MTLASVEPWVARVYTEVTHRKCVYPILYDRVLSDS